MKLSADAIITSAKVTDYLLTWRIEDDKSKFLALAGYTLANAGRLQDDLRNLLEGEAQFVQTTDYGDNIRFVGH
jgi:hypothetical protein